jgi:SAM-dependent methyltransferase
LFDVVDFNKHCSDAPFQFGSSDIAVCYYRCPQCEFIFSNLIDDWSLKEISQFIYNEDYIKIDPEYVGPRPLRTAETIAITLRGCEHMRILDYGSGSGIFADAMRSRGYQNVVGFDPVASPANLSPPDGNFDIITLFEVIEHLTNPLDVLRSLRQILSPTGAIVVGVTLQPSNILQLRGNWWYIAPRNGHVSIFSDRTFASLADRIGLVYRRGNNLYCFARPELAAPIAQSLDRIGRATDFARPHALFDDAALDHLNQAGSPTHVIQLLAPPENDLSWHSIEYAQHQRFRWSAVPEIIWPSVLFAGGPTMVRIPFLMEIRDGFAEQCSALIGGHRLQTRLRANAIFVQGEIPAGSHNVQLVTPAPLCPRLVNGANDERLLGLAVLVGF